MKKMDMMGNEAFSSQIESFELYFRSLGMENLNIYPNHSSNFFILSHFHSFQPNTMFVLDRIRFYISSIGAYEEYIRISFVHLSREKWAI